GVQPGSAQAQLDATVLVGVGAQLHVLAVEVEQAEEVDEVRLDEAQPAQVVQLLRGGTQRAQGVDLFGDRVQVRHQVHAFGAAAEQVLDLRAGMLVQHRLHHRQLVQVGVQQRGNDRHGRL